MLLERLFGPRIREHQEGQRRRCEELGLSFVPPQVLSNSRLAIEAAEYARDAGRHPEFHRAVLAAYFAGSADIGDVDVLARLAGETGLDAPGLRQALAQGTYADRRKAASAEAAGLRVTGVPTFLFASGIKVVGAQSLDHFRRLLDDIPEARS